MLNDLRRVRWASGLASLLCGLLVAVTALAAFANPSTSAPLTAPTKPLAPPGTRHTHAKPKTTGRSTHQDRKSPPRASPPSAPVSRMVGQMVMAGMTGTLPDADLLARVQAGKVGGIILFSANVSSSLPTAIAELQRAAHAGGYPPLLISVDQEGGTVRRFAGRPPSSPRSISTRAVAYQQGAQTAVFLRSEQVNVDLAPIADVTTSSAAFEAQQVRGFNGSPSQVATLADAFAQGLQANGVAATAKHFPGVGSLTSDTDSEVGNVSLSRPELEQTLIPFKRLIADHVDLVMVASASYPAFDPTGTPAGFSRLITHTLLRVELGYTGVAITDALDTPTDLGGSPGERAVRAAQAGADIILFAPESSGPAAYDALLNAAAQRQIPLGYIKDAYRRIVALKRTVAR
jgi:beta-N-acetylhexosaminidase